MAWLWFSLILSVLSLGVAWLFSREVIAAPSGSEVMKEMALAIKEGAEAFLRRQYITIYSFSIGLAILIFGFYSYTKGTQLATRMVVSFLVGAVCSGTAGATGMFVSIRANLRVAQSSRAPPLLRSLGAISGLLGAPILVVAVLHVSQLGGLEILSAGQQRNVQSERDHGLSDLLRRYSWSYAIFGSKGNPLLQQTRTQSAISRNASSPRLQLRVRYKSSFALRPTPWPA